MTTNEIKFKYIGWNHNAGHDKIWTAFEVNDKIFCAWGRRGAKLSFKNHGTNTSMTVQRTIEDLIDSKNKRGYSSVDNLLLFTFFPEFETTVKEELIIKALAGKIM